MSGHTRGPLWVSSSTIVCTPSAQIVANCTPTGIGSLDLPLAECAANARLFAAAPKLLEALRPMAEGTAWLTEAHVDAARAAIAEATGA